MEMVVHSQLTKERPSSVKFWGMQVTWEKVHFFSLLGFNENKALLKYSHIFIFCSGRAFQRYADNDNAIAASNMASKNSFTASNFRQTIDMY